MENGGGANGGKPWPIEPGMFYTLKREIYVLIVILGETSLIFSQYINDLKQNKLSRNTFNIKRNFSFAVTSNDFDNSFVSRREQINTNND